MLACGTLANVKVEVIIESSAVAEVGYSPRISHYMVLNIVMTNDDRYHVFREFSINFHLSNLLQQDSRDPLCID